MYTLHQVKKILSQWPGVEIKGKMKARTVDFTDLARCKQMFLEVNFARQPRHADWLAIREFCKNANIVLTNNQIWVDQEENDD